MKSLPMMLCIKSLSQYVPLSLRNFEGDIPVEIPGHVKFTEGKLYKIFPITETIQFETMSSQYNETLVTCRKYKIFFRDDVHVEITRQTLEEHFRRFI